MRRFSIFCLPLPKILLRQRRSFAPFLAVLATWHQTNRRFTGWQKRAGPSRLLHGVRPKGFGLVSPRNAIRSMAVNMLRPYFFGSGPGTVIPSGLHAFVKTRRELAVPDIEFMFRGASFCTGWVDATRMICPSRHRHPRGDQAPVAHVLWLDRRLGPRQRLLLSHL